MSAALSATTIYRALSDATRAQIECLEVLDTVTSTNTWLLERTAKEAGRFEVVLAAHQTAGRGRDGNRWISPHGAGLYLSIAHTFLTPPDNLSGITLAAGVAIAEVLANTGATHIKLKWPNDIYAGDAKLGGILTEAQSGAGRTTLVCGIGINLDLRQAIDAEQPFTAAAYPVTDLVTHCTQHPDAATLAAAIIGGVIDAIGEYDKRGIAAFLAAWNHYDWLKDKQVSVDMPHESVDGVAAGIDANGALQLKQKGTTRSIVNGTVRLQEVSHA